MNRYLVISDEKFIYASQGNLGSFIKKYSDIAPRIEFMRIPKKNGYTMLSRAGLRKPESLPKWK